jgi:hypothetical protein
MVELSLVSGYRFTVCEKLDIALAFGWRTGLPGLHLILGGARFTAAITALFFNAALAAEVTLSAEEHLFSPSCLAIP